MNKIKIYGSLFSGLLSSFLLGVYACLVGYNIEQIELYKWVITCLFTVLFITNFIIEFKKEQK